jgi:hypothetical protein
MRFQLKGGNRIRHEILSSQWCADRKHIASRNVVYIICIQLLSC